MFITHIHSYDCMQYKVIARPVLSAINK